MSVEYQQIALVFPKWRKRVWDGNFTQSTAETPTQMIFNLTSTLAYDISLEVDKNWLVKIDSSSAARWRECESAAEKSYITHNFFFCKSSLAHLIIVVVIAAVEPNESEWSEERRRNLVKRKKIIHRMKEKWRRREKTLQLWLCFAFGFLRGFHIFFSLLL